MNTIHDPTLPKRDPDRVLSCLFGLAHETGHQWLASARFDEDPGPGVKPCDLLTESQSPVHWGRFTQCSGSIMMYANSPYDIANLGDGKFETRAVLDKPFCDLDLYLMGLLPPEQVKPFFVVLNPDVKESDLKIGQPFHGTRKDVAIQDIIAVEGPRIPDSQHSQKDFRAAFVLVTRGEMPTDDEIKFVDTLRQEFEKYWFKATRGLSRMDTRLDDSIKGHAVRPSGGNESPAQN